eukprot:TRINITY_DN1187_c0_g1_i1.p1 TRINITY_DN1187_c0_g1~~TRINITY_DN1187_c0_g1_i1.p1  ORF type:complete len:324 (-),score=15.71 TRINITY_DN1187_c0_g1_i1:888-1859(-)
MRKYQRVLQELRTFKSSKLSSSQSQATLGRLRYQVMRKAHSLLFFYLWSHRIMALGRQLARARVCVPAQLKSYETLRVLYLQQHYTRWQLAKRVCARLPNLNPIDAQSETELCRTVRRVYETHAVPQALMTPLFHHLKKCGGSYEELKHFLHHCLRNVRQFESVRGLIETTGQTVTLESFLLLFYIPCLRTDGVRVLLKLWRRSKQDSHLSVDKQLVQTAKSDACQFMENLHWLQRDVGIRQSDGDWRVRYFHTPCFSLYCNGRCCCSYCYCCCCYCRVLALSTSIFHRFISLCVGSVSCVAWCNVGAHAGDASSCSNGATTK